MWIASIIGLAPFALIVLGLILLKARARLHRRGQLDAGDIAARVLTVFGWIMLLSGVFGLVAVATHAACLIACTITAAVLAAAVCRYREAEQKSLLWLLTAAARRGIPLEVAARAFANERDDAAGIRARVLADYLEAGVPLALALGRSRHRVPESAMLAADLGERTGTLAEMLHEAACEMDELEMTLRAMLEKFLYLAVVVVCEMAVMVFLCLKIFPVFTYLAAEQDLELPALTQCVIALPAGPLGFLLPGLLVALLVVGVIYYVRLSPRSLPVVRLLWRRADGALVLRWLAVGVRQKRPIAEMLRLLASYFPRARVRSQLSRAVRRMDAGAHWCDSLQRVGLLRRRERVLFRTAERAGNLAWALEEMADGTVRRLAYRMRAWLSAAFPVGVLAVGACVFFVVAGVLLPLVELVQALS